MLTENELIKFRRELHSYPETGWCEFVTTHKIVEKLRSFGLDPIYGRQVINPEFVAGRNPAKVEEAKKAALEKGVPPEFIESMQDYTGVAAIFETGRPGPVLAIRFDMDCVDVDEAHEAGHRPFDEGWASTNPGHMHSCGHDGHATMGIAVCNWIQENLDQFCGTIKVVFQPAEEGVRGARPMTETGIFDDVDFFFGNHLGFNLPTGTISPEPGVFQENLDQFCGTIKVVFQPAEEGVRGARPMTETGIFDDVDFFFGNHLGFNLPTGTISPEPGVFLASTKLDATFTGLAAHSGADPQKGKNALLAGAAAALAVHGITRPIGEVTALNVGTLVAGQGRNVVAPNAFMQLEVRGETEELNAYMRDQAIRKIKASADMYDCQVDIVKAGEATEFKPDQEAIELAYIAARNVTTEDLARPLGLKLGSEDCTIMLRRVQQHGGKGTFVVFGCRTSAGHHQRLFDFDEDVIGIALRFYQNLIPMIVGIK